ncbi:hypothetical protein AB6A23_10740 [Paenibacillus tarimensis]
MKLKAVPRKKAVETIGRFTACLSEGMYSAEYGHEQIKDFLYQYYSYIKSMNYSTRDILDDELLKDVYLFKDIDQFRQWMVEPTGYRIREIGREREK